MAMTLITNSADTDSTDLASISFTSGIDSTYKLYIFKLIDLNPATDNKWISFQGSIDSGSNYNVTMTSTFFRSFHSEDGGTATLEYGGGNDQGQGTAFQPLTYYIGNGADESASGTLWLFNPSNTTYVKHWYSRVSSYTGDNMHNDTFAAGYFNNTNDIDAIQFKMSSGNMDGTIKMYGVG